MNSFGLFAGITTSNDGSSKIVLNVSLVLIVCRGGCRHHLAHQSVYKGFVGRLRGLKDTVQVVGANRTFIVPSIRCL